ncbi:IS200/IS605 family transposase [Moorena sp. SIO3A2]|uniref:IS200/IS605 family transposase n=1 Tax=Moorena sp. SIO3A2 TaxID=2607841 RepID=UPI0013BB51D4|nr:IS200/IS605 family transposase [Moorena sp. SIO3A2]NER90318.1 IS200/IS605 family transposase [Moorena sp. SIO3A2]
MRIVEGNARVRLTWVTKRRRGILVNEVANRCEELIYELANQRGWVINELEINLSEIHLSLCYDFRTSIVQVWTAFKRHTYQGLTRDFPHLRGYPCFWTASLFFVSEAIASEAEINTKVDSYLDQSYHDK